MEKLILEDDDIIVIYATCFWSIHQSLIAISTSRWLVWCSLDVQPLRWWYCKRIGRVYIATCCCCPCPAAAAAHSAVFCHCWCCSIQLLSLIPSIAWHYSAAAAAAASIGDASSAVDATAPRPPCSCYGSCSSVFWSCCNSTLMLKMIVFNRILVSVPWRLAFGGSDAMSLTDSELVPLTCSVATPLNALKRCL